MSMVHACAWDGCAVLTMGEFCLEHEHFDPGPEADRRRPQLASAGSAADAERGEAAV
jgi:hypothetical protein